MNAYALFTTATHTEKGENQLIYTCRESLSTGKMFYLNYLCEAKFGMLGCKGDRVSNTSKYIYDH